MDYSPTVRGRRLMRELARLRQAQGLSLDDTARRLDFSRTKMYRIESGRVPVTSDDLQDMLDLYGVRSPQRDALIQLGRDARKRGWQTAYTDVFTGSYIGFEAEAASIRISASMVPGLFQTEDYAREVITRTGLRLEHDDAERKVAARIARQRALLGRDDPPQIHVVLDEAALHRQTGGPAGTRDQLTALAHASARPEVTVQVLPFTAGGHAGMDGDFVLLTFPDPQDPPVAYVEGLMGDVYVEADADLDLFSLAWAQLVTSALDPGESTAMISQLAKEN